MARNSAVGTPAAWTPATSGAEGWAFALVGAGAGVLVSMGAVAGAGLESAKLGSRMAVPAIPAGVAGTTAGGVLGGVVGSAWLAAWGALLMPEEAGAGVEDVGAGVTVLTGASVLASLAGAAVGPDELLGTWAATTAAAEVASAGLAGEVAGGVVEVVGAVELGDAGADAGGWVESATDGLSWDFPGAEEVGGD